MGIFVFGTMPKYALKPIFFERHSCSLFSDAQNWPENGVKSLIVKMYVR